MYIRVMSKHLIEDVTSITTPNGFSNLNPESLDPKTCHIILYILAIQLSDSSGEAADSLREYFYGLAQKTGLGFLATEPNARSFETSRHLLPLDQHSQGWFHQGLLHAWKKLWLTVMLWTGKNVICCIENRNDLTRLQYKGVGRFKITRILTISRRFTVTFKISNSLMKELTLVLQKNDDIGRNRFSTS